MDKKKSNQKFKRFRKISHPRNDLTLSDEYIDYLNFKKKKVPLVRQGAIYDELLNYFDPYDVGLDLGNKQIRHTLKRDEANNLFFHWEKVPKNHKKGKKWYHYNELKIKEINQKKLNAQKIYEHITQQKKWYWTGNPFSPVRVLGGDIDNRTDNPALILPFLEFFEHYYPNSFYDQGSSGKSLHYYPKIDMLPLYEYFCNSFSIKENWAAYANKIIRYTSRIFKIYGRNILCPEHRLVPKILKNGNTKYVPEYLVEFDAFKGTYPEYNFYYDKENKPVITKMIKNGVLHKFPNIFTVEDLSKFRDAPVYSITYHLSLSIYLCNQVLLSGCYSERDYKILQLALHEIEPILEAHSVLSPCQGKNSVSLPSSPITEEPEERENNILCIYTGTFETVEDIQSESDALIRSRRYLYYCYMNSILREGKEPTKEEYRKYYRQDVGTGLEDEEDSKRLNYVYDTNIAKMRKYAFGTLDQKIVEMEHKLDLSQEEIDRMSSYDRTLHLREVAITAVWIELCLTNVDYIARKKWWSLNKGLHYSRELTVPMTSLEKFIECLKEKGLNQNGCNPRKAKALRELLTEHQWMLCVDDSVVIAARNGGKEGRARRYILLPSHPGYQRFEALVGKDRIEYWMRYKEEQSKSKRTKRKRVG